MELNQYCAKEHMPLIHFQISSRQNYGAVYKITCAMIIMYTYLDLYLL